MDVKERKIMERHMIQPFTEQERKFAEENHNFIYGFLRKHGYSIEEFYNIAVFGYLKAVQVYHRKEKLNGNYNFSSIADKYMRAEISNHFKSESRKKRKPAGTIVSLDDDGMENNCVGGKSAEAEILDKETVKELLDKLTEVQRKIAELKMDGYSNREVYLFLEIKPSTYYKELQRIKTTLSGKDIRYN